MTKKKNMSWLFVFGFLTICILCWRDNSRRAKVRQKCLTLSCFQLLRRQAVHQYSMRLRRTAWIHWQLQVICACLFVRRLNWCCFQQIVGLIFWTFFSKPLISLSCPLSPRVWFFFFFFVFMIRSANSEEKKRRQCVPCGCGVVFWNSRFGFVWDVEPFARTWDRVRL